MRDQLRQPPIAELVAKVLRERILSGELADGDLLPPQEALMRDFRVSKPSIREALRILETEGLVSVRRGKFGGAVVHIPTEDNIAYMFEMVIQSRRVPFDDVARALRHLEPVCTALCAMREDRHETVLPALRAAHEDCLVTVEDFEPYARACRRFHEVMVECCGNETLIMVVGALELMWSAHAAAWAKSTIEASTDPDMDYRRHANDDHALILRLIERGDADAAAREIASHIADTPVYSTAHAAAWEIMASRRHPAGPDGEGAGPAGVTPAADQP